MSNVIQLRNSENFKKFRKRKRKRNRKSNHKKDSQLVRVKASEVTLDESEEEEKLNPKEELAKARKKLHKGEVAYPNSSELMDKAKRLVEGSPSQILIEMARVKIDKGLFKPLLRTKAKNTYFTKKEINIVSAILEGASLNDIAMYYGYGFDYVRSVCQSDKVRAFMDLHKEWQIFDLANLREKAYDYLRHLITDRNVNPSHGLKALEMWLSTQGELKEPEANENTKQALLELLTRSRDDKKDKKEIKNMGNVVIDNN